LSFRLANCGPARLPNTSPTAVQALEFRAKLEIAGFVESGKL
jgi:hypothetical protein